MSHLVYLNNVCLYQEDALWRATLCNSIILSLHSEFHLCLFSILVLEKILQPDSQINPYPQTSINPCFWSLFLQHKLNIQINIKSLGVFPFFLYPNISWPSEWDNDQQSSDNMNYHSLQVSFNQSKRQ